MNYEDRWGRFHHKPCKDYEPSSNNGWIYTAYAEKLKIPLKNHMLELCFKGCITPNNKLNRHPSGIKSEVPISRDEILGMASLGFLKPEHLNGWNFCPYDMPSFNLIKTIKQFLELRGKHRNYLWQNKLDHTYRFAFSVPLVDRHFILQKWGKFNFFYWMVAKIDSILPIDNGIGWLKYGKDIDKMKKEFPEDHPIQQICSNPIRVL